MDRVGHAVDAHERGQPFEASYNGMKSVWFPRSTFSSIHFWRSNARQNPSKRLDILHVLEDGDLVAVHSHVRQTPDDRGAAMVHLFRFEGDRIAELWDIGQPVPAESPNPNGMF